MDNNELLSQVLAAMQEQTEVLTKMVDEKISQAENRLNKRIDKIELKIENEVTKKIEALFDGYKLTHEKQWEMQMETQRELNEIKRRLDALENKTA